MVQEKQLSQTVMHMKETMLMENDMAKGLTLSKADQNMKESGRIIRNPAKENFFIC